MGLRTTRVAAVGFLLALSPAWAQEPSAVTPSAVFGETVEVRVVNLEVVVTDRDGLPVTGLAVGDFDLRVDGAELPIRYFSEVRGGQAVEPVAGSEGGPAAVSGVPDLVPGEPVGTSYLVYVDDYFAIARDRNLVLAGVQRELSRLGPEDRMAVVAYDGQKVEMLSSWTSSASELERAFKRAAKRPAFGLQRLGERRNLITGLRPTRQQGFSTRTTPLDNRLEVDERFYAQLLEQQMRNEITATVGALRGFANPPGRKVMLLLSGGWPFDIASYVTQEFGRSIVEPGVVRGKDLFAPLVDTANQLGYTLFPVDVPGLSTGSVTDAGEADLPTPTEQFATFVRENNDQYSLHYLAHETGGRAMINAGRTVALERAAAETRTYYWLGFVPSWQGDDRPHRVEVTVRREGLKVRNRTGYVDMSKRREVSMAVESILLFGDAPGAHALQLRVGEPQKGPHNTLRATVELAVPAVELTLLPIGGHRIAELELRVAAMDDRGGRSDIPVLPVRLTVDELPQPGQWAVYRTTLELRRTRNHVVVALYDPVAGTIWSASADVRP